MPLETNEPEIEAAESLSPADGAATVDASATHTNRTPPTRERVPTAPPIARRWIQLLLGLGVAVAVGLAPFLGRIRVAGFVSLLSVFPESIQTLSIALASVVMGVIATTVQFYGWRRMPRALLNRWFPRIALTILISLFTLTYTHVLSVCRVSYVNGQIASFVIGFGDRRASCLRDCPDSISNQECIQHIGMAAQAVESCWGDRAVHRAEIILIVLYLAVMGLFGALVGLVSLQLEAQRAGEAR